MTKAILADGTELNFPDDTDPAVIDRVVKQHIGGQQATAAPTAPAAAPQAGQPTSRGGFMQNFRDFTTEATSQATLGLADYVGAAAAPVALLGRALEGEDVDLGQAYRDRFAQIRQGRQQFQEEHPVAATTAQVAGAATVAPNIVGGITKAVQTALPQAIPRVVSTGLGLAAGGATEGAIVGGLEAEPGRNVEGAVRGGITGAALAPTIPGLFSLTGAAARRTLNLLTNRGPQTADERKLLERITADGLTPRQVLARLRRLGPDATIADAGGDNLRGLAEDLAQQPGATRNIARRVLETRQGGQSARLAQEAQRGLDASGDYYGRLDDLARQRSQDARPLYEEAFAITPWRFENLQRFVEDPIVRRGINQGLEIQRLEALADGVPFNPMDYGVKGFDADGNAILGDVPNMRLMDAAKRGLDEIINEGRDAVTGRMNWTQRLRAVDRVRRSLVAELDELTGGAEGPYARARAAWSGPSQAMDAMYQGRRFMRGDPEVTARIVEDMDEGQREFFREGVFQELQHRLGGTSETRNQTLKYLRTPNVREALRAVFPDDRSFRLFMAQAMRENIFSETRNVVRANSATARRHAGREDLGVDPNVALDAAQGRFGAATLGIVRKALASVKQMPQTQRDRLGTMLLSQDANTQQRALMLLYIRYQRGQISQQHWEALRNLVAGEAAVVGAEAALPGR